MITIRKALIFATLAISGATAHGDNKKETSERGTHLRGKPQQQQSEHQRNLVLRSSHHLAHVGECPNWPQATGMACHQYIPLMATETTCFYGQTQCDCDTAAGITWTCRPIPKPDPYPYELKITPAPVPSPTQPPTQPAPPTARPTMAKNSGTGNVHFYNVNPSCPATKPAHDSNCPPREHHQHYLSCTYWDSYVSKFMQCDCGNANIFVCRPSNNPSLINLASF